MGEIAPKARVPKGTLYVYFDSKERLFEAIAHEECGVQTEAVLQLCEIHALPGSHVAVAHGDRHLGPHAGDRQCEYARNIDPTSEAAHPNDIARESQDSGGVTFRAKRDPIQEADSHARSMTWVPLWRGRT